MRVVLDGVVVPTEGPKNPCIPSPCGSNADCKEKNGAGSCVCQANYSGDPYIGCRPECVLSSDCPANRACRNNKCFDPCPGTCGIKAQCEVINHIPTCSCPPGFIGNALAMCKPQPPRKHRLSNLSYLLTT